MTPVPYEALPDLLQFVIDRLNLCWAFVLWCHQNRSNSRVSNPNREAFSGHLNIESRPLPTYGGVAGNTQDPFSSEFALALMHTFESRKIRTDE
jgi:hypothetical protein